MGGTMISMFFGMLATMHVTNYLSDTENFAKIEKEIEGDATLKDLRKADEADALKQAEYIKGTAWKSLSCI